RRLRQHEGDQDPEAVERRQRDHLLPVVERADDDEPDREQADAEDRGGRVARPNTGGSWSCWPIAAARRPQPEKLVEIASTRIAQAVAPTPIRRAAAN